MKPSSPTPSETSLRVKIGQITTDPHGTDVHVVVVNILSKELKGVDVRCRAHDAQGMQVAESSTHIASVAPSDITFGRVIFPAEITAGDNTFTCEIGKIAAADGAAP